ncbi:MAG: DNA repair protein RecO [bacterium]
MRRIARDLALCLRVRPHRESSKLVTFFTRSSGRLTGIAKGARRPKSRLGAALEPFALSEVTWYWHEQKTVYTISDAALARAHPGIPAEPARFLAAEQFAEFLLRATREHDANEALFRLGVVYLGELEAASGPAIAGLAVSFLLKAASFAGFRPEVRKCLGCGAAAGCGEGWRFDPGRGGAVCPDCGAGRNAPVVPAAWLAELSRLLHSPASELGGLPPDRELLGLVRAFVARHVEVPAFHSFNWQEL